MRAIFRLHVCISIYRVKIAQMGARFIDGSAACLSRPWADEAGAAGGRPATQRNDEADGGVRHPKKAAAYFAREVT